MIRDTECGIEQVKEGNGHGGLLLFSMQFTVVLVQVAIITIEEFHGTQCLFNRTFASVLNIIFNNNFYCLCCLLYSPGIIELIIIPSVLEYHTFTLRIVPSPKLCDAIIP